MTLRSGAGRPLRLGRELFRGGEGAVHEITGAPELLAKIYHQRPEGPRARKLRAMAALSPEARPAGAAWPLDVVLEGAEVAGFVMHRLQSRRELHDLFAPRARKTHFLQADYRFLVAAAANLARAVATVHAAGAVIGDINERLALVDGRATVGLVDCDSFQFEADGERFGCDVGVPAYQAPELQGKNFRGLIRTRNHDSFGLAVLIFQLLFFNRHPFAGVPLSGEAPPIDQAIREYRFAWSADAEARGVRQPPNTLPFRALDERLRAMFERSFGPAGSTEGRHKALAWARALDAYGSALVPCRTEPKHAHLPGRCPICALEAATGTPMFIAAPAAPQPGVAPGSLALPDFSEAADRIAAELARRPAPLQRGSPPREADHARHVLATAPPATLRRPGLFGQLMQAFGLGHGEWQAEVARRQAALDSAVQAYDAALPAWQATSAFDQCQRLHQDVQAECTRLREVRRLAESAVARRRADSRKAALRAHLDRFDVAVAGIEGIGPARLDALASAGIETAADVTEAYLPAVPGFGPKLQQRLLDWRRQCEAGFTFDENRAPLPPVLAAELAALRAKGNAVRDAAEAALAELDRVMRDEATQAAQLRLDIDRLARAVAQARADLALMQ